MRRNKVAHSKSTFRLGPRGRVASSGRKFIGAIHWAGFFLALAAVAIGYFLRCEWEPLPHPTSVETRTPVEDGPLLCHNALGATLSRFQIF